MPSDAQEFCSRSPPAPNPAHGGFAAEHLTHEVCHPLCSLRLGFLAGLLLVYIHCLEQ